MKRKWWFLCTAIAAALLSLCFFGVRLRIAPRLILSRALGTALTELETRFANSPAQLFDTALDKQGNQKAALQVETQLEHLGIVRYDMSVQTQLNPRRVKAAGIVITGDKALDLSLFLDQNFAAVSSHELLGGNFYGITYDSFSQDIRSRELLAALIGSKTISQWEESVSSLDEAMSREVKLPEWKMKDVVSALYGVLALKPRVSRIDTPAGAAEKTDAVTFHATGREIADLTAPYREELAPAFLSLIDAWEADPSAFVEAVFYLHKGILVEIHLVMESSAENTRIFVTLGTEPETQPLAVQIITEAGENHNSIRLEIETVYDKETYQEKLQLSQTKNRVSTRTVLDYAYDLSTGELDLTVHQDEDEARIRINLEREGDTLTLRTQDAAPLLNLFLKKPLKYPIICTLNLSSGSLVTVPEYRSLDQWSAEDLVTLLSGIGGLLGLKTP